MNVLNLMYWKSLGQISMLKTSNANKHLADTSVQILLRQINFSVRISL